MLTILFSCQTENEETKESYRDSPYLLVLDWEGNAIKRFDISPEAKNLSIDHHKNILYFVAIHPETLEDELYTVKVDDLNL